MLNNFSDAEIGAAFRRQAAIANEMFPDAFVNDPSPGLKYLGFGVFHPRDENMSRVTRWKVKREEY